MYEKLCCHGAVMWSRRLFSVDTRANRPTWHHGYSIFATIFAGVGEP